jgi:hypothetical protein
MLELLNQLDGFSSSEDIKVQWNLDNRTSITGFIRYPDENMSVYRISRLRDYYRRAL